MPSTRTTPRQSALSTALAKNRLGVAGVGLSVASSVAPLTVVAGVVTTGMAVTGQTGVSIALIAVALVLIIFVVGYVAMARHITNAGAFYAYVAQGIWRPAGVGASWIALVAYNGFLCAAYGGLGFLAAPLLQSWFGLDVPWWAISLVAWLLVGVLGIRDVGISEKVLAVLVLAETALVLLYSFAILFSSDFNYSTHSLQPSNLWGPGAGALVVIGATAFVGVEQGAVYVEESRDPRKTVPRATYLTIILIAVLYAFASWVQISAAGDQAVDRAVKEGPDLFFNLAAVPLGSWAVDVGHVLFVTSLLAAMIAFHNIIARYMFALGRESVLPRVFGRTNGGAPRNSSLVLSLFSLIVITVYAIAGWDPLVQLFFWGGSVGAIGILLLLTLTSIAVICYFARHPQDENAWHRIGAPAIATVLLIVISYLALTNLPLLFGVEPGTGPAVATPLVFGLVFLGGILWGLALKVTRPAVYEGIGLGARSAVASTTGFSNIFDETDAMERRR